MSVNGKQVFAVFTIIYIVWYFLKVVHRPKLYYSSNALTTSIVKNCKSLKQRYFPLFLFHGSYFQMFISVIIGKIYHRIFPPNYNREMFSLKDGQQIALDWTFPPHFNRNNNHKPIIVALYGIAGDNTSLNILRYCKLICNELKMASVVLGRRGHESDIKLTVPKMSVFGLQNDIHEVLLYINNKYPQNQLILLGDSAGTGFWVRYTGDLALCINKQCRLKHNKSSSQLIIKQYENAQIIHNQILCSILISPGYDIGEVFCKQNWFSKQLILFLLKQTFIRNHNKTLTENYNEDVIRRCNESNDMLDFFRTYSGHLSGYKSYNEFLIETNPTETGQYAQIPSLVINSRDDPICTHQSLDEWKWLFIEKKSCPNAILLETKYGSHCAFLNIFATFWLDSVILDYIKTIYQLKGNQNQQQP